MLYLIYTESANYCGHVQHFVVEAPDEETARDLVADAAEEYWYEQDGDQYREEHDEDEDADFWADIKTCEEFGPGHESWQYYQDPGQAQFYIEVIEGK